MYSCFSEQSHLVLVAKQPKPEATRTNQSKLFVKTSALNNELADSSRYKLNEQDKNQAENSKRIKYPHQKISPATVKTSKK